SLVQCVFCLALGGARVEDCHSVPQNRGTSGPGQSPRQVLTPVWNTGPKKVLAVLLDRVQDTLVGAEVDLGDVVCPVQEPVDLLSGERACLGVDLPGRYLAHGGITVPVLTRKGTHESFAGQLQCPQRGLLNSA